MTIKQNHLTESDLNRLVNVNRQFLHTLLGHEKQLKKACAQLFAAAEKGTEHGEAAFSLLNEVRDRRRLVRTERMHFEGLQRRLKKMQRGQ